MTIASADTAAWPVRSGSVPPLADGFITRPESAPRLAEALAPGTAAVLVAAGAGGQPEPDGPLDWLGRCGKTQLAVHYAESLWRSGDVDLLVWVSATSRVAVLSGFAAAAAATGVGLPAGDADSAAVSFAAWLGATSRRWLVVFDDLSATADLTGLWPSGASGRLLVTASAAAAVPADRETLVFPVGPFSSREALGYLMDRLSSDPGQRLGAVDLARELGGAPLALAQASGVIASSALTCGSYREHLTRRRRQLAAAAGYDGCLAPAEMTWSLAVEQAGWLSPGGTAPSLLALAALLDGHAIPASVFSSRAVAGFLAQTGDTDPADRGPAREALLVLERGGLLAAGPAGQWQAVRMSPMLQAAVRDAMPGHLHERAVRAAAAALLEVWPADDRQAWPAAGLRAATASLAQAAGGLLWGAGCHPLLVRAGRSLDGAGLTAAAVTYWRELAADCDTMLGPGHPDTALAGEALASARRTAGRAAAARRRAAMRDGQGAAARAPGLMGSVRGILSRGWARGAPGACGRRPRRRAQTRR